MRDRIDPLIAERAPWLFSGRPHHRLALRVLMGTLGYAETVALAETFRETQPDRIMDEMAARIARRVSASGLDHLPANGPALIVSNHPTGIADGIVLYSLLAKRRPDLFFFANRDILRVLPQMETMIAPVEWRPDRRSHSKTRETMEYAHRAVAEGRLGVIFPSGRLAKRVGLNLHERPWMASAAMLARRFDLPVVPVNMQARNSSLFYLFDAIHPTLRDITLFHETLNKHRQRFAVRFGHPIPAAALPKSAASAIDVLRKATLDLGGGRTPPLEEVEPQGDRSPARGLAGPA